MASSSVRMTRTLAGLAVGRDQRLAGRVPPVVEGDPEESEPLAGAAADLGGVLADAAGEDERVQPAEGRAEGPDPGLDPVAEQVDRLGRAGVALPTGQQVAQVGAGLRDPEEAGLLVDHAVEPLGRHALGVGEEREEPGVDVAAAGPHDQAGGRGEAHRRVEATALAHRGQARARAEVRQDDPAPGLRRPGDPGEFLHEVGVRQPVEPVAPDAEAPVPPRDRDDLRGPRHRAVEGRVEARDLRDAGDGPRRSPRSARSPPGGVPGRAGRSAAAGRASPR